MTTGLKRLYGLGHLHYITCSCYGREPLLQVSGRYLLLLKGLEVVRERYAFRIAGYVLMPEHFHLLMSEPEKGDPSQVMFALKQTFELSFLVRLQHEAALVPKDGFDLRKSAAGAECGFTEKE